MTISSHPPIKFLDKKEYSLFIGGRWEQSQSGNSFESLNPSTGTALARISAAGEADINRAVMAAKNALDGPWSKWTPVERQRLLLEFASVIGKHFDELATIDSLEMGAPISRTLSAKERSIALVRHYAGSATSIYGQTTATSLPGEYLAYTLKQPVGVVGAIIPWNGPLTACLWKLLPALTTGCTVVLKPAPEASLSAIRLAELLAGMDLPHGVVNVVTGDAAAGKALVAHPLVDKIAFTGSTQAGQDIVRASAGNLKRLSLELGGKSPNIVFADADLEAAAAAAALAAFNNSGQICSAGTRLFVERPVYQEFLERVAHHGKSLRLGPSLDATTQLGPLVSQRQMERVTRYVKAGIDAGARLLSDASRPTGGAFGNGYFVAPVVFIDVTRDMKIAQEEIFGPVISGMPFNDVDEVLRMANDTAYGLGAGVWTKDLAKASRVAKRINCGVVWTNCYQVGDPALPFGGTKMSGYGKEMGVQHIEEYMNVKSVFSNLE